MSDDLVRRLRAEDPETGLRWSLASESADRIEALEAALRYVYSEVKDEYGFALVEEKILAALSWEKKDD